MSRTSKQPGNTSAAAALVFIHSGFAIEQIRTACDKKDVNTREDLSAGEHISKRIKKGTAGARITGIMEQQETTAGYPGVTQTDSSPAGRFAY